MPTSSTRRGTAPRKAVPHQRSRQLRAWLRVRRYWSDVPLPELIRFGHAYRKRNRCDSLLQALVYSTL
jgi:hypothetical protein